MTVLGSTHRVSGIGGQFTRTRSRTMASISVAVFTCVMALGTASPTMAQGGDNDADGLANGEERKYGTERTNPDTDGDGLLDGDEVFVHLTNPTLIDSDYDWLSDGDEVGMGTNPLGVDTDGDGLTDFFEIYSSNTDPNDHDTDRDFHLDSSDRYPLDSTRF